jgi:hypothetical protein
MYSILPEKINFLPYLEVCVSEKKPVVCKKIFEFATLLSDSDTAGY